MRGSPMNARETASRSRLRPIARTLASIEPPRLGDRARPEPSAAAGETSGSRPEADVVTASAGTGPGPASRAPRLDRRLHPIDELLRGRAEVGAGRIGGIVGRVDRLRRVVRVGVGGRGRARMEIAVALEVLPDQRRAEDDAVASRSGFRWPDAALRAARFRSPPADRRGRSARVNRRSSTSAGRTCCSMEMIPSVQARCRAATTRSIALMPMKGRMRPPRP